MADARYRVEFEPDRSLGWVSGPIPRRGVAVPAAHPAQHHPGPRLRESLLTWPGRPGLITRETKVASIGSCFAGNIKRWLVENGYPYLQCEEGPGAFNSSVRVGEVYSTACLRQIIEHAHGRFHPVEEFWTLDGCPADPYRSRILWPDEDAARRERAQHAEAIARMIRQADVLIVTLGFSEVWRSRADGSVFAMMPIDYDPRRHEFHVLSVAENHSNLETAYALLRSKNPRLQLVVTLSPVPLNRTFTSADCIVADCSSKARLRVAIDEFVTRHPEVVYFPSFEMVREVEVDPWEEDGRHVRPEVVARIMEAFMASCGPVAGSAAA